MVKVSLGGKEILILDDGSLGEIDIEACAGLSQPNATLKAYCTRLSPFFPGCPTTTVKGWVRMDREAWMMSGHELPSA